VSRESLTVGRIGVYDTFDRPFPPDLLADVLDDRVDPPVTVVEDRDGLAACDAVVALGHDDAFLDTVEWVHEIRAGYDDYPVDRYEEAGIVVTNSSGLASGIVAESVIGLMLTLARGFHRYRDHQASREWGRLPWGRPFLLGRSSLCVVGMGQIGSGVATRAGALGMDVTGVDVRPVSALGVDHVYDIDDRLDVLADARFVALTTPLTPATEGLVSTDELAAMREDAFLVNAGRGGVVDQDALVAALETGEIAGAAVDVFAEEPLPAESPLWEMDEVIVTPHVAGQANHYHELLADLLTTSLARVDRGKDPWNRVV